MGTIADKLTHLAGTKQAIKQAIIDKGVKVADTDTFRSYATKIADISGGGGYDFPDITSIVENDTDNEYRYKCIWLLDGENPTFDYTFGADVKKVLLSDGTIYKASFTDHVWGDNTDTSITDYKYIILYMSSNGSFQKDGRPISMTYNSAFLSGINFSYMFSGCSSLQTIPLLNTSGGTIFSSMFSDCSSLQTIPLLDTSSGTNFSNMFLGCNSLQTIPLLDTSGVVDFSNMFSDCYSLQTIPSLNTSNGTGFYYMFSGCKSLQYLDTSNVSSWVFNYSIDFTGCSYLSHNTALGIINNLPKLPETTEQTIKFHSTTLAKLTAAEKGIATGKGWVISNN